MRVNISLNQNIKVLNDNLFAALLETTPPEAGEFISDKTESVKISELCHARWYTREFVVVQSKSLQSCQLSNGVRQSRQVVGS